MQRTAPPATTLTLLGRLSHNDAMQNIVDSAVARSTLFHHMTPQNLGALVGIGISITKKAKEPIILRKEPVPGIFLVRKGLVDIFLPRQSKPLKQLGADSVVGEMSFLENKPASATIRAGTEGGATLTLFPRKEFLLLLEDASFASGFFRGIAEVVSFRLRSTTTEMSSLRQSLTRALADGSRDIEESAERKDPVFSALKAQFDKLDSEYRQFSKVAPEYAGHFREMGRSLGAIRVAADRFHTSVLARDAQLRNLLDSLESLTWN